MAFFGPSFDPNDIRIREILGSRAIQAHHPETAAHPESCPDRPGSGPGTVISYRLLHRSVTSEHNTQHPYYPRISLLRDTAARQDGIAPP